VTYYEVLLFLHIAFAIVWLGSALLLQVLGHRAVSANELVRLKGLLDDADWLTTRLFIPSSLAVLVLGVLLTIEGPWEFGELWIVIGLAGYAASFLSGLFVISRQAKKVARIMERDGGMSTAAVAETNRLFLDSRVELVVLFVVVLDMAMKPRGEDVGTLVVMAGAVFVGAAYSVWRFRTPAAAAA
jgi:hypothetical protein